MVKRITLAISTMAVLLVPPLTAYSRPDVKHTDYIGPLSNYPHGTKDFCHLIAGGSPDDERSFIECHRLKPVQGPTPALTPNLTVGTIEEAGWTIVNVIPHRAQNGVDMSDLVIEKN